MSAGVRVAQLVECNTGFFFLGGALDPAGHRDGELVGGKLLGQPELYFGRMFSGAK